MRQIRSLIAIAGLVIALAPVGAQAGSNEDLIAQNQAMMIAANQQANLANDMARCKMALAGLFVPGTVAFSLPAPTGGCTGMTVPAPAPAPAGASGACTSAMRSLTKAELDKVNEFEIAAADAIVDHEPAVKMSADVVALIGCT